jgi:hypothetical protein
MEERDRARRFQAAAELNEAKAEVRATVAENVAAGATARVEAAEAAAAERRAEAELGLGRIVALYYRSSTSYQNR